MSQIGQTFHIERNFRFRFSETNFIKLQLQNSSSIKDEENGENVKFSGFFFCFRFGNGESTIPFFYIFMIFMIELAVDEG